MNALRQRVKVEELLKLGVFFSPTDYSKHSKPKTMCLSLNLNQQSTQKHYFTAGTAHL